jgi:hypothetical protein
MIGTRVGKVLSLGEDFALAGYRLLSTAGR